MVQPGNILLSKLGDALLTDFGIAIQANTDITSLLTAAAGTQHFASPEQVARGKVNAASDVYSLGRTLVFSLSGAAQPLRAPPMSATLQALVKEMLYPLPSSRPIMAEVARRLHVELTRAQSPQVRGCLGRCDAACAVSRCLLCLRSLLILSASTAFQNWRHVRTDVALIARYQINCCVSCLRLCMQTDRIDKVANV